MKTLLLAVLLFPSIAFCASENRVIMSDQQRAEALNNAPKYYRDVARHFQEALGRDPTEAESIHFGALLASGTSPAQIDEALRTTHMRRNRRDEFVRACLQSMAGTVNIYRHEEVEEIAIHCADRLMAKLGN